MISEEVEGKGKREWRQEIKKKMRKTVYMEMEGVFARFQIDRVTKKSKKTKNYEIIN